MPGPDDILRNITKAVERFTQHIGQIADLFLEYISTTFRTIIDFLKTAAEKIYRFTKEMLINTLKLIWAFLKVILFFLAPIYVLYFGLEIVTSESALYLTVIGWFLLCAGVIGIILFTLAFLASFVKATDTDQPSTKKIARSGGILIFMDIIAIGLITASVLWAPEREFQWWLSRKTESLVRLVVYQVYKDPSDKPAIAKIVRVTNNRDETVKFQLRLDQTIHVFAIGSLEGPKQHDYGWIEDALTGKVVWQMTEPETTYAGGSQWNRKADKLIRLKAGSYKLRYISDNGFSYDNWYGGTPPEINFWGIAIYREY